MATETKDRICAEIQEIMKTYREQEATMRGVDTPGGLEHMGDVWRLLGRWDRELLEDFNDRGETRLLGMNETELANIEEDDPRCRICGAPESGHEIANNLHEFKL